MPIYEIPDIDSQAPRLDSYYLRTRTADIPIGILSHTTYVVDKKNVIVCEDRTATSYNISRREFKQNAHSKWRMFVATLTSTLTFLEQAQNHKGLLYLEQQVTLCILGLKRKIFMRIRRSITFAEKREKMAT